MTRVYAVDIGTLCDERGWSRTRLMHELRRAAQARSIPLPAEDSLKRMIREWANGRRGLSDLYAELLTHVFGVPILPGRDAGQTDGNSHQAQPTEDPESELTQRLDTASTVDGGLVALLEGQTQSFRLLDRRLGAVQLLTQTEAHLGQIIALLRYALPGTQRAALGAAAAEAAALAGWQALDLGKPDQSWDLHETAKTAARETDDPTFLAHVTAQQAYALLDMERTSDALMLMQHARKTAGTKIGALLQAWLWAAEAEALAANSKEREARLAMDTASQLLPNDPVTEELPFLVLDPVHLARWRGCSLALLGADEAIEELTSSLASMDPSFTRARGGMHCDLALAYSAQGDHSAARKEAKKAASLASITSSIRQRKRIAKLLRSGS
jgi:hypothetical protein